MSDSLTCPITCDLFRDPVVAADGHTYEREAIVKWIHENGTSPITRQRITIDTLISNYTVKKLVEEFEEITRSQKYQFKLDVDVKRKSHIALFTTFGKKIHEAEWLKNNSSRPKTVLLTIDGARAQKEAKFYVDLTRHPNIVRTFGLVDSGNSNVDKNSVMLLQEYAPEGNLNEVIQHKTLDENVLIEIFIQITNAMIFLAHNHVVHADLVCRNVLVFQYDIHDPRKNVVKLTDFGISRHSQLYAPTNAVTRTVIDILPKCSAAPEVLANATYSEKSDIYSMGVLMWEAYSKGAVPWSEIPCDTVKQRVCRGDKLQKPSSCSTQMWLIIDKCFALRPQERPSFVDLKDSLLQAQYQKRVRGNKYRTDFTVRHCFHSVLHSWAGRQSFLGGRNKSFTAVYT
ncbi:unnamed protein product [Didymodactylos carnosus]|uniref:Uncharacterized protein n=1 Tax=Didymodactylos carnosus TaxID=1234261 RepID=A0A814I8X2_9BILA|nr:unnamed protein product [Didymodactylos carnosus]CAF3792134.1 unnamed protein product [Didymodactylos carnosus]